MKYLGIDWAKEVHLAALLPEGGEQAVCWDFDSGPKDVESLVERLGKEGGPAEVLVAMEPGALLLLDALLEQGFRVWLINPLQVDRARDRYSPSGAKDDRRDAEVIARTLRSDRDRLRELRREDELTEELLLRDQTHRRLVDERVALGNQLRAILGRYYPALAALDRPTNDPFLLAFLARWPEHEMARGASLAQLRSLIEKHRLRTLTAQDLRERLRAPTFHVRPPILAACRDEAVGLVTRIKTLNEQIRETEQKLDELFEGHPDRDLFRTLPGLGKILAIRVGAGFGRNRLQVLESTILQGYAGTAPITRSTGSRRTPQGRTARTRHVSMRRACNRALQAAMHQWALASRAKSRWARAYYDDARKRGMGRNAALRALGNKWIKILSAVMKTRVPYDDARHTQRLIAKGVRWAMFMAAAPEAA